ncbi:MAG TPA: hypothetical protein VF476_00120 [Chitinophagaceae bacterium]
MMKLAWVIILSLISSSVFSQTNEVDSCSISPTHIAMIDGLDKKGMLSTTDMPKIRKLVSDDKDVTILRFTYSVDCDGCDIDIREVFADTLSREDMKVLAEIKPMRVLSFECIVGKNKKGELVAFKPFLFYIKP